jgi:putative endonuclease
MFQDGLYSYHFYIITNLTRTVLYAGITNNLGRRLHEHAKNLHNTNKSFTSKYKCKYLLYYEKYGWVMEAIAREKEVKGWSRSKKLRLIRCVNPNLKSLNHLFPFPNI